jgi:hypothetical protein
MGILKDLWIILSEDLEGPSAFLVRWHLKTFPVEKVYALFAAGKIQESGVYGRLRLGQVGKFIALHEKVKGILIRKERLPPDLACIAEAFTENPRRTHFAINQIDMLIERDLEKGIRRKRGENVVRREF